MEPIDIASLVLRVVLGAIMLIHGINHARGRARTSRWFGSIGFRSPQFQWFASTATELGVGVLLLVGLGTSLAVAGLVGIMTVAFLSVHRFAGFWITARPTEGYEYVLTLTAAAAALGMIGPGKASIDQVIGLDVILDGWWGLAAVGFGIVVAFAQVVMFYRPKNRDAAA